MNNLVVDIFRDIVLEVENKIGYPVNYQFGDWSYMAKILAGMSKTPVASANKYPLIGLFSPFVENRTDYKVTSVSLKFIIATVTKKDYTNEERLENSFKSILHPVYNTFIEEIKKSRAIQKNAQNIVKHKYVDNYRYGSYGIYGDGERKFDDAIDGIDISDMELEIKNNLNCKRNETIQRLRK